jgi:hypothetical protein
VWSSGGLRGGVHPYGAYVITRTLQTSVTSKIPASVVDYARGSPCADAASLSHCRACSVPAAGLHTLIYYALAIVSSSHSDHGCVVENAQVAWPNSRHQQASLRYVTAPAGYRDMKRAGCECAATFRVLRSPPLCCSRIPTVLSRTSASVELLAALHKRLYPHRHLAQSRLCRARSMKSTIGPR